MRRHWSALTALLLASPLVGAQQVPQTPPIQPAPATQPNPALNGYLQRWEKEMKSVKTFQAQLTRIEVDPGFSSTDVYVGTAKYMQPSFALLEMKKRPNDPKGRENPDAYEKYLCTGTFIYEWRPGEKKLYANELPKPKQGQVGDDNVLSMIFTVNSEDAKRRYDLQMEREDQYYVYIKIMPRTPADKADFKEARLVLNKDTFMPRELWFKSAINNQEVKWDIPKIQTNVQLDRKEFAPPSLPPGWKLEQNVQPRVIREKQP